MDQQDPFQWLEDVESPRALEWVDRQNAKTLNFFESSPYFLKLQKQFFEILSDRHKAPTLITLSETHLYDLWQDANSIKGLIRRCPVENPGAWEVLVDLDALSKEEKRSWVYKWISLNPMDSKVCLLALSDGGADKVFIREFDLDSGKFVADGFSFPESKSNVTWISKDELLLAGDFGPDSLTRAGYPRTLRKVRRGQDPAQAPVIFEGKYEDQYGVYSRTFWSEEKSATFLFRGIHFYLNEMYQQTTQGLKLLSFPQDCWFHGYNPEMGAILQLKTDLQIAKGVIRADSLVAWRPEAPEPHQVIRIPSEQGSLESVAVLRDGLVLFSLENVSSRVQFFSFKYGKISDVPVGHHQSCHLIDGDAKSNTVLFESGSFLEPFGTWIFREGELKALWKGPERFATEHLQVEQHWAQSADGVRIPYFLVGPRDLKLDGLNPCLVNAYGGFQVSKTPLYNPFFGLGWLKNGGVFVLANLRGGNEFGPHWHQSVLKLNRKKCFEDLEAVIEDLHRRKITSPAKTTIMGGSNGGLLVGSVMVRRPDLMSSVICEVPLLDMQRYHLLLAGSSWMAEYGDPEHPEEGEYLLSYSPYHRIEAGKEYPLIFFYTSTKDDRVHPGHARKMAARMQEMGHPFLYFENREGGHGRMTDPKATARLLAMEMLAAALNRNSELSTDHNDRK